MSKNVYQVISEVCADLAHEGISKDRSNAQQGYKFRGIDDVLNSLSPIISKRGLVILPRILSREMVERQSAKGTPIFTVVVEAEFDFVSSHDGSKHTVKTFGEAMDSADKATNKAMSAAYKYAAFQAFCIPTEGDNDADAVTHSLSAKPVTQQKKELSSYDDKKLRENIPAWQAAIISKKHTAESIINMISTKHTITEEQKETIRSLGESHANA